MRPAADTHTRQARDLLTGFRDVLGADLVDDILTAPQQRESELQAQRERLAELGARLDRLEPTVADGSPTFFTVGVRPLPSRAETAWGQPRFHTR